MTNEKIPRLMIVVGNDPLKIESSFDDYAALINNARKGACSIKHYDPSIEEINTFVADTMTASLFSEVRLLCIPHVNTYTEKNLEALGAMLDYEIPDVYIHISAEVDPKSKDKAAAKLEKHLRLKERSKDENVAVINVKKDYDNKLPAFVVERAQKKFKRKISVDDARMLLTRVEYDFIDSELIKLDMTLPAGAPITKQAIEEIVGVTRTMTVNELSAALASRDLLAALNTLDSLLCSDFYAPLFTSAVFKHFWSILKIKKYLEKNPDALRRYRGGYSTQTEAAAEIGRACGLMGEKETDKSAYPKVVLSGVVEKSQKFSEHGLRKILKMLQRFDVDTKTGRENITPYTLQMLCYKIIQTK